jgi:hypothetical protein
LAGASFWANATERFLLPPTYHEVAAVIGWDAAIELGTYVAANKRPPSRRQQSGNHNSAGKLYVSRDQHGAVMRQIAAVIGEELTTKLSDAFGGEYLEFCGVERAFVARRNRAVVQRAKDGWAAHAVAMAFDLSERQVRRICKDAGLSLQSNVKAVHDLRRARLAGVRDAVLTARRCGQCIVAAARDWGFAPDVAHAIALSG